jgi:acyl transferase domain-containing protein
VIVEESKEWTQSRHTSSLRNLDDVDDFFAEDELVHDNKLVTLVFSANDEKSLQANVKALEKYLIQPSTNVQLSDLAYTLSQRRTHHFHRAFVITNRAKFTSRAVVSGKKSPEVPRIGFVFTGQGAQWPQMGKLLIEAFPLAKELTRKFDGVLQQTPSPPSWTFLRMFRP